MGGLIRHRMWVGWPLAPQSHIVLRHANAGGFEVLLVHTQLAKLRSAWAICFGVICGSGGEEFVAIRSSRCVPFHKQNNDLVGWGPEPLEQCLRRGFCVLRHIEIICFNQQQQKWNHRCDNQNVLQQDHGRQH